MWYYDTYDVSAHPDGSGNMVANSLQDLTYRENRFAHDWTALPYPVLFPMLNGLPGASGFNPDTLIPFQQPLLAGASAGQWTANPVGSARFGEDVVLTNVVSFDVKVWDPQVIVKSDGGTPAHSLVPSDQGYANASVTATTQPGAYVDLFYNCNPQAKTIGSLPSTYFSGPGYGAGVGSTLDATAPLTWTRKVSTSRPMTIGAPATSIISIATI